MKTIKILAISIMAVMLFACSDICCGSGPTYRSYITSYIDPQEMLYTDSVYTISNSIEWLKEKGLPMMFTFVEFYPFFYRKDVKFKSEFLQRNEKYTFSSSRIDAREREIYDSLCLANNDMKFNNSSDFGMAVITPTKSFDVVCNQDFDAGHPAGVSLNNYYRIGYNSAKEFIDSKYNFKTVDRGSRRETLNEFNSREHPLMRPSIFLGLNILPETAGDYTFTITYKDVKGKTLSVTTEPVTLPARG